MDSGASAPQALLVMWAEDPGPLECLAPDAHEAIQASRGPSEALSQFQPAGKTDIPSVLGKWAEFVSFFFPFW